MAERDDFVSSERVKFSRRKAGEIADGLIDEFVLRLLFTPEYRAKAAETHFSQSGRQDLLGLPVEFSKTDFRYSVRFIDFRNSRLFYITRSSFDHTLYSNITRIDEAYIHAAREGEEIQWGEILWTREWTEFAAEKHGKIQHHNNQAAVERVEEIMRDFNISSA